MNVLITGADGQLARDLIRTAAPDDHVVTLSRKELDITSAEQIEDHIKKIRPDWVINTAAYTWVDQAESEKEQAFSINRDGPRNLAMVLAATNARLVHYSTDYVFDGKKCTPYTTLDIPSPVNVYGQSKLEGEWAVTKILGEHALIIRTSWLYSGHGINFVTKMLELMQSHDKLQVVSDQTGTPTWTRSLACATWEIMAKPGLHGIHHYRDDGETTWFEFAHAILAGGLRHGLLTKHVNILPIWSDEYGAPATRPPYSVLECGETWNLLRHAPDDWRVALDKLLAEMAGQ